MAKKQIKPVYVNPMNRMGSILLSRFWDQLDDYTKKEVASNISGKLIGELEAIKKILRHSVQGFK